MSRRRPVADGTVPMINVVFLMLIFFLMTATLAPPAPLDVLPPDAQAGQTPKAGTRDVLYVGADASLAFGTWRGDAALAVAASQGARRLILRADARLEGAALARLLARLASLGVAEVALVTSGRSGVGP